MKIGTVLKDTFRPTRGRLILLAVFLLIAVGGLIQSSEFTSNKSPLLPVLRPFPLWVTFVYLMIPLVYLTPPLQLLGLSLFGGPTWFTVGSTVLYFYVLACLLATVAWAGRSLVARLTRSV